MKGVGDPSPKSFTLLQINTEAREYYTLSSPLSIPSLVKYPWRQSAKATI